MQARLGVGDVGAAQVQRLQLAVAAQERHRRIGDEFGGIQIQIFQLIEPFSRSMPRSERRSATDRAA